MTNCLNRKTYFIFFDYYELLKDYKTQRLIQLTYNLVKWGRKFKSKLNIK